MSTIYYILSGTSSNYTSIWADPSANINSGRVYIATGGSGAALSIVDIQRQIVIDSYMIDKKGGGNEFLDDEGIVDINISTLGS